MKASIKLLNTSAEQRCNQGEPLCPLLVLMIDRYPPNVRHCMYGSDADLMLLDLMIHEPHFTLVREVVVFGGPRKGKDDNAKKIIARQTKEQEWQLVHLSLFRQYLNVELRAEVRLHIYVSFDVTFLLIG